MHDFNVALEFIKGGGREDLQQFILTSMKSFEEIHEGPRAPFRKEMATRGFTRHEIQEIKEKFQALDASIPQGVPAATTGITIQKISAAESTATTTTVTEDQPSTTGMALIPYADDNDDLFSVQVKAEEERAAEEQADDAAERRKIEEALQVLEELKKKAQEQREQADALMGRTQKKAKKEAML